MSELTLDRRIDRLEARAKIEELVCNYCIAYDDRDMDLMRSLMTEDVIFRSKDRTLDVRGADALTAMFQGMFMTRGPSCHWTTDRVLEFDEANPDRITGRLLGHAETTPNGVATIMSYRYDDVYRRISGEWKFAERELSLQYSIPVENYVERITSPERCFQGGSWRSADYPERLGTWQQASSDVPGSGN